MTFADIPPGASVFFDANTLVYHFAPHPSFKAACKVLLLRVMRRELSAFTSLDVLSDVAHRVMTLEAIGRHSWPSAGIAQRLRNHPHASARKTRAKKHQAALDARYSFSYLGARHLSIGFRGNLAGVYH